MRRIKTVLGVVAVMAAMSVAFAAPAMANDHDDWDWNDRHDDDACWFLGVWVCDDDDFDRDRFDFDRDRFDFGGAGIDQDFDQEAESGDVDQSFDVSGTGDNSNQTVGTQGVANTGNAQNQIGVIDVGGFGDFDNNNDWWNHNSNDGGDFEFDDVGSTIELSPTNTTFGDQQVNQAATAFGR